MNIESIKKLLKFIGKYRFLMAFSVILAAIFVVLSLYVPILFGDAIDRIVEQGSVDLETVLSFLAKAGVCVLLAGALQWVMNLVNNRITYNTVRDIRNKAFKNIERLPLKYLDAHPHGDLVSRVISDVDQLAEGLLLGFSQFFTGVATIICTLGFMLSISPLITIIAVVLTPLSLLVSRFVSKYSYKHFKEQSEIRGRQTALIDEMVGGQRVVQAYSYANESQERFDSINKELQKVSVKAFFISSLVNPSTRFVNSMVYAAVGLGGAILAATGGITIGGLTCLLSYANQYTKPFNEISGVITELQNAVACATRIFELIEAEPEPSDAENKALEAVSGRVELENVEFSYTPEKPLINGFNLSVQQGQRVAIVGPTGCGKTTLINLLMRFYDVLDGEISVDGNNIQEVTRESLRRGFGMVLQETWLKNGTVRENIALGKPNATLEEVIEAAKASHAHSFIKRLPNGYDTVISDENSSFSQGERQLLCIARIMLALPPMLILDEATSSIDTRTEIKIQKSFSTLMRGRTSFIVAHRLSTIKEADMILVMKSGKIVEMGSHEELLSRGGFYKDLYSSQFDNNEI